MVVKFICVDCGDKCIIERDNTKFYPTVCAFGQKGWKEIVNWEILK